MKTLLTLALAALPFAAMCPAHAALFDFYILRTGDGVGALTAANEPVSLLQFQSDGTAGGTQLVSVFDAPMGDPSTQVGAGGNFSSTGQLNLSLDGNHLMFAGWGAGVGASLSALRTVVPIVIVDFDLRTNTFDTSTRLTNVLDGAAASGSPRGISSVDGSEYWMGGFASGGTNYGITYATKGATTGTGNLLNSLWATADTQIYNGNIYFSRANGVDEGVWIMAGGVTSDPEQPFARLPTDPEGTGWNGAGGYLKMQILDDNTMLVAAIQTANDMIQQIQIFTRDQETDLWSQLTEDGQYINGIATPREFTAIDAGTYYQLFFTSAQGNSAANTLYAVTLDKATWMFGTPELLLTPGAGYSFSGVAGLPAVIPEPSALALLGLAGAAGLWITRRRKGRLP